MMDDMATTPYTFRMDDALREALEHEARLEERPAAQLAIRAIRSLVQSKAAKRAAITTALAEAEQGEFLSQDAMNHWIDSWGTADELPMPESER